jgi:hypothetical protein
MLALVSMLVALSVGAWVVQPIVARRAAMLRDVDSGELLDARARRGVTFAALKELEYEYLGGKLDENDYAKLRDQLQREALVAARAAGSAEEAARGPAAAALGTAAAPGVSTAPGAAETAAHACGYSSPAGSRFCGGCGAPLSA